MQDWQPSASIAHLQQRAAVLAHIRQFFAQRAVLEVEVPVLSGTTTTDANIESLAVHAKGKLSGYLQTSPEFFLKRLLVAGSGPVYSLGKAFRQDEHGRRHNPEFTMLEWYRPAWGYLALASEVETLLGEFAPQSSVQRIAYGALFQQHTGLDPHTCTTAALQQWAKQHIDTAIVDDERTLWLDLIFSMVIEPALTGIVTVMEFPACQASLAQLAIDAQGREVAQRFEVFWDGMELANGYQELQGMEENRARLEHGNAIRVQRGQQQIQLDERFLSALSQGLAPMSGVALGVDRLVMRVLQQSSIDAVMAFAWPVCSNDQIT